MTLTRQEAQEMRLIGRAAAKRSADAGAKNAPEPMAREFMRVTKTYSDGRVDLDKGSSESSMPVLGVRVTSACAGIAVGDIAVVDTYAHVPLVTNIIASSLPKGPAVTFHSMDIGTTGSHPTWIRIGSWYASANGQSCQLDVWTGSGYNGNASQNSSLHLFIKNGYQSSPSTTKAFGCTVSLDNCTTESVGVKLIATAHNNVDVWINFKTWDYWKGHYTFQGYSVWDDSTYVQQSSEPGGVSQEVAYVPSGFTVGNGISFDGGTLSSSYQKILWQAGGTGNWMGDGQTITFIEPISKQPHGAVFAWCLYKNNTSARVDWTYFFVPKQHVSFDISSQGTRGICMSGICEDTNFAKYVYVNDTNATGYAKNRQEVTFGGVYCSNANFVLMAVIGV